MKYVTIELARAQTYANDADDLLLNHQIEVASEAVADHLESIDKSSWLDEDGRPTAAIPKRVQQAVLWLVADYFRNREGEQIDTVDPRFGYGYLPRPVVALLYPLRQHNV